MNKRLKFLIIAVSLALSIFGEVFAFVHNRSESGETVKWQTPSHINFHLNTNNSDGLTDSSISSIATNSISQWSSQVSFGINLEKTSYSSNSRNDIYFADSTSFFSDEGIIAVTAITYNNDNATILETDIVFNDAKNNFSTNYGDRNYIGDVLSHEIGHSLGLAHSQVLGSTMFYRTRYGQASINSDDISGIKKLYNYKDTNKGTISGKIVGSSSLISIFGAHVSAISQKTGEVISSSVSEDNGDFSISGLELDETYYIYTQPLEALSSLPEFYKTRRVDFCENRSSYRGSFFQSCLSSQRGYPQGIVISTDDKNINVGYVSIKCGLDTPTNYMLSKSGGEFELDPFSTLADQAFIGEAFVGYFSATEVLSESEDQIHFDLSQIDWNLYSNLSADNLYLEIKSITQPFYSPYKTRLTVQSTTGTFVKPDNFNALSFDSELNPDLNAIVRIPINKSSSAANDYIIKVKAKGLVDDIGGGILLNDIIPSSDDFMDPLAFYFLTINVVKKSINQLGEVSYIKVTDKKRDKISDNRSCADASYAYQASSKKIDSTASSAYKRKSNDSGVGACGTIAFVGKNGPPPGGPMSVGLFMMIFLLFTRYKSLSFLTDKYHNK